MNTFNVGDFVEAQDPATREWRTGQVSAIEPYRGRPGYYVLWVLPADAPSWLSRGGWQSGNMVRERQGINVLIDRPIYVKFLTPDGTGYGVTCYTPVAVLNAVAKSNQADHVLIRALPLPGGR